MRGYWRVVPRESEGLSEGVCWYDAMVGWRVSVVVGRFQRASCE
jgi:hypothetical protein